MQKKLGVSDKQLPQGSTVKITNGFVVLKEDGDDQDHDLFLNKDDELYVFANPSEIMQTVNDHNRENPGNEFLGTIIIANVITFWK